MWYLFRDPKFQRETLNSTHLAESKDTELVQNRFRSPFRKFYGGPLDFEFISAGVLNTQGAVRLHQLCLQDGVRNSFETTFETFLRLKSFLLRIVFRQILTCSFIVLLKVFASFTISFPQNITRNWQATQLEAVANKKH